MLEDDDGVVIADGLLHQTLRVIRGGRADDLQAGAVDEVALEGLGMLRAAVRRAAGSAHDHGHMHLAAGHVAHLGGLVDELIHHAEQEVAVLQVGHGAHAVHGGAHAHAGDQDLGDGGVDDADVLKILALGDVTAVLLRHADVGAELVAQTLRDGERTAHAAGDVLILAQAINGGISAHFLSDGCFQRIGNRHNSHIL